MSYFELDGKGNLHCTWQPTAKNKLIRASDARNRLRVGGTGSSKSSDAMMDGVVNYLLSWKGCYGLILRRTMDDLRMANIPDFKAYVPDSLYKFNESTAIATFFNGSKLFFSHMTNFSLKDLEGYQSASFPWIFIDECGAFPGEVWTFMQTRNRVNPQCLPNEQGEYPRPVMMGACNPIGAHWGWYLSMFREKKPEELPEGSRKDRHGRWWSQKGQDWRLEYDPFEWEYVHSTVMDNPHMLAKDPDIVHRLNALPQGQREKLLDGYMDSMVGQYFDCFDPAYDKIDVRDDPDAIIWQEWQPRWLGWDWGRAHWNAIFWFTKALVRRAGSEYRLTTVCYREYVDKGRDHVEMADVVERFTRMGLPGRGRNGERIGCDYRAAYFSHEKFTKQMEAEEQQAKLSKELMARGLSGLTRATRDRNGRATLMYNLFKRRELVILDNCPDILRAIPQCVRDEDNLEDVLKVDTKADDCFVAGTMVLTEHGERPIETITVGDRVLTRAGLKAITRVFVKTSDDIISLRGSINLTGTGDHRIWTSWGWSSLRDLPGKSVLRKSSTADRYGDVTRTTKCSENISCAGTNEGANNYSIDKFGLISMGARFLTAMKYIMQMTILTTMSLTIWSAYWPEIIVRSLWLYAQSGLANSIKCALMLLESGCLLKVGTLQMQASNGIVITESGLTAPNSKWSIFVLAASVLSWLDLSQSTVRARVCSHTTAHSILAMFRNHAKNVASLLRRSSSMEYDFVAVDVQLSHVGTNVVYDLTVEEAHEFFANGILVRQCYDGFSYGLFGQLGGGVKPREEVDREKVEAAAKIGKQEEVLTRFRLTHERDAMTRSAEERHSDSWD